jgi:hypothetical protein
MINKDQAGHGRIHDFDAALPSRASGSVLMLGMLASALVPEQGDRGAARCAVLPGRA